MCSREERLQQLREETSSHADSESGSEGEEEFFQLAERGITSAHDHSLPEDEDVDDSDAGESFQSENVEEQLQLSRLRDQQAISTGAMEPIPSSSDGETNARLARLKRQRHFSSSSFESDGSNERQSHPVQLQTYDSQAHTRNEINHNQFLSPGNYPGNLGETNSNTRGYVNIGDSEAPASWDRHMSESSDELPRPPDLRRGVNVAAIQDFSTSSLESSDVEGWEGGALIRNQDVSTGPQEIESASEDGHFDYRSKLLPLSAQEIRSFVFHDIQVSHHVPREAVQMFAGLHTVNPPLDSRTTKKRLKAITGLEEVRYDCCIEGCISYALPKYASLTECPVAKCKHPRSKGDGTPYSQHSYIPITHRLRLMYSDKERAREMMAYRAKMDEEIETEVCNILISTTL